jgi:hypothetical protein
MVGGVPCHDHSANIKEDYHPYTLKERNHLPNPTISQKILTAYLVTTIDKIKIKMVQ